MKWLKPRLSRVIETARRINPDVLIFYHSCGYILPFIDPLIDIGVDHGILGKSGSWYSYGDTKLGQGRDAVKNLLADNPELAEEIEKLVREKLQA